MLGLNEETNHYYKLLKERYEHCNLSGIVYLAYAIAVYDPLKPWMQIIKECADTFSITLSACERCLRYYIQSNKKAIVEDIKTEDVRASVVTSKLKDIFVTLN